MPVIAVDGPAGSGKSSVCREVARRCGLRYLDTGAMYRAVTWALLEAGVDVDDADAVAAAAPGIVLRSGTDPAAPTIHVGPVDVSGPIRGQEVTAAVSAVSAVPEVRELLVAQQRAVVRAAQEAGEGIVVEGRDITTVVLPDADMKVFVTADPSVRAQRRLRQDEERGSGAGKDVQATEASLAARDAKDSSRVLSPLTQADDAMLLDTTSLTLEETIDRLAGMVIALERR